MKTNYTKHLKLAIVLFLAIATNFAKAQCVASFTPYIGANGQVTFVANVVGAPTPSATVYSWNFNSNVPSWVTYTGTAATMNTYTANGCYTVALFVTTYSNSVPTCSTVVYSAVCVTNVASPPPPTPTCNASFTYAVGANGNVTFGSTSTGSINASTSYTWGFGSQATPNFSMGTNITHPSTTYTANGVHTVFLVLNNSGGGAACATQQTISVNTVTTTPPCNLNANFSYTTGANGIVYFNNTSTGTTPNTSYSWNFGDGGSSSTASPAHTYTANGTYLVTLFANASTNSVSPCIDTTAHTVVISNITNTCIANTTFSLIQANTPHSWYAVVTNTGNVAAAQWSWGDSTANSFGIVVSHTYAAAGNYQICLTVTTTCGTIGTHCSTQYLSKSADGSNDIVYINTVTREMLEAEPTDIKNNAAEAISCIISPNPNSGEFNLNINGITASSAKIQVYNLMGGVIFESINDTHNGNINKTISLENISNGVYFIRVNAGDKIHTQKLVITKQ
ncbi:MAG: PKD domain-containing protein [Bacteroidetes bacterium]|nr:PKD domain-containing protein [Bacteroidota bacterium]